MRIHGIAALLMLILGSILLVFSAVTLTTHGSVLDAWLSAVAGMFLVFIGLVLLITSRLEGWLSGGQTALVDGLQAG